MYVIVDNLNVRSLWNYYYLFIYFYFWKFKCRNVFSQLLRIVFNMVFKLLKAYNCNASAGHLRNLLTS